MNSNSSSINKIEIKALMRHFSAEEELYKEIIKKFKEKHGSLKEFERKLSKAEIEEHPNWEESIEWRNAIEELRRLKQLRGVLSWTKNFC